MKRPGWLLLAVLGAGCATTSGVAPRFTYAPAAGTRYVRTVKLVSETSLVGAPYRHREEQEFVWNVSYSHEGENTLVTHQLQRLAVRIDGAEVLDGERAPGMGVTVDLVVDPSPRVIEVRGAEKAAELLTPLLRDGVRQASDFSVTTELVRRFAVARFEMMVRDVVGHPTDPGASWPAADADPAIVKKTMTVDRIEACGQARCARVSAQYEVNPRAGAVTALRSAAAFLIRNGVDPGSAEVVDATLEYRDELLLEPGTLVDHGASFAQTARVTFARPDGQALPVEFRSTLEQSSMFP